MAENLIGTARFVQKEVVVLAKKNRHHIRPVSQNGKNDKHNIAFVDSKKHDLYHRLFFNMTPDEIIKYLVTYFWKNQWEWVDKARN